MSYKSGQFIADYLNSLPMKELTTEVVPSLLIPDEEEDCLHEIISLLIGAIFKNCKSFDDASDLATSLKTRIKNGEKDVFSYVDFSELTEDPGLFFDRESCEDLSTEIICYLPTY